MNAPKISTFSSHRVIVCFVQGDQKVCVHLTQCIRTIPHTTDELKMAITEYFRNVDRAILNTVFKNTVRRVNNCLETVGGRGEGEDDDTFWITL